MDYLAKAMSLFENGVPTHKDYEDAILKPRKNLSVVETRVNASAIDAVGYYISAYEGLKNGTVNRAYRILVIDQCFAEDLPLPLTTNTLKRMYDEFLDNLPVKDVATIEAVLANEFAHAKQVMTDLVERLNEHDLRLCFDDNYHEMGISVEHKHTGRLLYDTLKDLQ